MGMPQELYYELNRVFDRVRSAEREAAKLEQEAAELRDEAHKDVSALYAKLNASSITLPVTPKGA